NDPEYEILDTGIFDKDQYFDVLISYAKQSAQDIFIRIEIKNRYTKTAPIYVLPTLWFYNRWEYATDQVKPAITSLSKTSVRVKHDRLDDYYFYFQPPNDVLFTENENNTEKISGT